ncbi:MAG: radical SAM protein [Candidatus Bathyarchaeia archaeon]
MPTLGQNRQFKFTNTAESFPPPLVPGYAATMLKEDGHKVFWHDGIINRALMEEYNKALFSFNPDLVVIETKTPLIYKHWAYVEDLKKSIDVKAVLVGDHVSWNPEESMLNSRVDFAVAWGDYDYAVREICRHIEDGEEMPPGVWYREAGRVKNSGSAKPIDDLDTLPFIDWALIGLEYHEAYLYRPTGYIMTGRGCGGGPRGVGCCIFCVWQHAFWKLRARLRSPAHVAEEIAHMTERYRFREVFDDNESGAIYDKKWLAQFQKEMKDRGLIGEVRLSSNSRADNLDDETCRLLKSTGFRLLKIGLESGSNETLKRINKKETVEEISAGVKNAKDHGLRVKITTMTGFPWETEADVQKTYDVTRELMRYKARFGDCLQSSVLVPYPGTPLYYQALRNVWFAVDPYNYEEYDMSKPVLKCSYDAMEWCEKIWRIHKDPLFMLESLLSIRSLNDVKLGWIGVRSLRGHEEDQRWNR